MELTIENKTYNFRFGIGFVRYLDGKSSIEQNGVQFGIGLETLIPNLLTGNTVTLSDCLFVANRTENPRVTQDQLDNYIDNENTDIDVLFDDVLKELKKSNATKKKAEMLMKEYEEKMQEEQDQAM
nr:MAG TPA: tail assembly chaperone [Caudoviricetes sp.]